MSCSWWPRVGHGTDEFHDILSLMTPEVARLALNISKLRPVQVDTAHYIYIWITTLIPYLATPSGW